MTDTDASLAVRQRSDTHLEGDGKVHGREGPQGRRGKVNCCTDCCSDDLLPCIMMLAIGLTFRIFGAVWEIASSGLRVGATTLRTASYARASQCAATDPRGGSSYIRLRDRAVSSLTTTVF